VMNVTDNYTINWTKGGNIQNINITYSNQSGADGTWVYVSTQNASNATWNWSVPDDIGNNLRINITDTTNPEVTNFSANNFMIVGKLNLAYPDGGELFRVGDTFNITWTYNGTFSNISIIGSWNDFATGSNFTINATVPTVNKNYTWPVEDYISNTTKVRIFDKNTSRSDYTIDQSSSYFNITGNLSVVYPNGSEILYANESTNLEWSTLGSVGNVSLRIRVGPTWYTITENASSSPYINWQVFYNITNESCRLNVTSVNDSRVSDESDAVFAIRPKFNVTSPQENEYLSIYTNYPNKINWSFNGTVGYVDIVCLINATGTNDTNYTIARFINATTAKPYTWYIDNTTTTNNAKIESSITPPPKAQPLSTAIPRPLRSWVTSPSSIPTLPRAWMS